jgi:hypothetical protein
MKTLWHVATALGAAVLLVWIIISTRHSIARMKVENATAPMAIDGIGQVDGIADPYVVQLIRLSIKSGQVVEARGDGRGDLDCYFFFGQDFKDPNVHTVANDASLSDGCRFEISVEGPYMLFVQNVSPRVEHFEVTVMTTNEKKP